MVAYQRSTVHLIKKERSNSHAPWRWHARAACSRSRLFQGEDQFSRLSDLNKAPSIVRKLQLASDTDAVAIHFPHCIWYCGVSVESWTQILR